ncbi:hypothetical protein NC651_031667 [Populus alba x Populus x berolinensis]|nr:hypothetical protein NC651_031667 [Populus alba x Populus x berolinensis]
MAQCIEVTFGRLKNARDSSVKQSFQRIFSAGVAFSRSVDGSIRSRKATSRLIIVEIMAEGYVMRVNPGIGQSVHSNEVSAKN